MSMFTIRIELHNASWQNYVDMANDLATKSITDVIVSDNGTAYKMPPAEYNYVGNASIDDVYSTAQWAANRTGKANAILVSEATRRKWNGLEVVHSRRSA